MHAPVNKQKIRTVFRKYTDHVQVHTKECEHMKLACGDAVNLQMQKHFNSRHYTIANAPWVTNRILNNVLGISFISDMIRSHTIKNKGLQSHPQQHQSKPKQLED